MKFEKSWHPSVHGSHTYVIRMARGRHAYDTRVACDSHVYVTRVWLSAPFCVHVCWVTFFYWDTVYVFSYISGSLAHLSNTLWYFHTDTFTLNTSSHSTNTYFSIPQGYIQACKGNPQRQNDALPRATILPSRCSIFSCRHYDSFNCFFWYFQFLTL